MEYQGFKSQALDFNIYSDGENGVSVESVTQQYALAPEGKDASGQPEPEKTVVIDGNEWTLDWEWKESPSAYTDYPTGKNTAGTSMLITSAGKNFYWERQVTYYSNSDEPVYSPATKSTMLDVDFINALGITAKKITVLQNNTEDESGTNRIIFEADGFNETGTVKIGGFNVDQKSLYSSGVPVPNVYIGTDKIELVSGDKCFRAKDGKIFANAGTIQSKNYGQPLIWNLNNLTYSTGLEYTLSDDGNSYNVSGIGTCTDTDLIIPLTYENLPVIGISNSAFSNNATITSVTIGNSVTSIGYSAFNNCDKLTSITIPSSVTSIGSSAFYNCTSLMSIYYGGTIDKWVEISFGSYYSNPLINADLYINNEKVTEVNLTTATYISDYAFYNCNNLTSVTIGNSVTSIGEDAFRNCSKLTSITIPNSVTSIGDSAFSYCNNLTSVTIGNSVTSIGWYAFYGCDNLTSVYYGGNETEWKAINNINSPSNINLTNATRYYYSETQPTEAGNYWHYGDGFKISCESANPMIDSAYFKVSPNGTIKATAGEIGAFNIENDKLYSNNHDTIDSTESGIYLGSDGLSIGSGFKVFSGGTPIVAGYTKSVEKKYCIVEFDVIPAILPDSVSEWWEKWDSDKWENTPPDREDGMYIWEWTQEEKGDGTFDDKGKVCITGATGAPGPDGVGVKAVIPQYALTRENNGIQYYSINPTTEDGWESLLIDENPEDDNPGRTPTAEEIPAALKATSDAWWADAKFETLLSEYWNKNNAYSNTLWTREETQYSSGDPTYSTPREDAGGSAIGKWCLENDRTLINGAHIATGTVTAQQIDTGLLNAAGVVISSPDSPDTGLLKPTEEIITVSSIIQPVETNGDITEDPANTYNLTLTAAHAGLRLDLTKLVTDQTYRLKFKFTDLYKTDAGMGMGAARVTHLGGNIGWPVANFRLLKAAINNSPIEDPSVYDSTGYTLDEAAGPEYDVELEFTYLGMNNTGGIDNADNYFYISPNRCFGWSNPQTTFTQITVTEISCISQSVLQYNWISQGSFVTPVETDPNWTNDFPDWTGLGSVWRRIVTKTLDASGEVTYNYGPAQLLTAGECARIRADKAGKSVGEWCKDNNVTILDGSNLITGTIDANEVDVIHIKADNIEADTLSAITADMGELTAGCIQSKDYDEGSSEITIRNNERTTSSGLLFTLSDDTTYYIVSGIGTCIDTDIVIPSIYNHLAVRQVANRAFKNCTAITSIYVPQSVTQIGYAAFTGCSSLQSITLPFVGQDRGKYGRASSINLFGFIFGQSKYTGGTKVTQTYNWKTEKEEEYYIPSSLKTITITGGIIGHGAFSGVLSSAMTLILEYGVQGIDDYAFYYNRAYNFSTLTIPNSVKYIGNYAFTECGNFRTDLAHIIIPDSVKTIGRQAFSNCSKLGEITIGSGVEKLGSYAFYNCSNLSKITIKEGIRILGDTDSGYTFWNCPITTLEIPSSVTRIGVWAFRECKSLTSVITSQDSELAIIGWGAFDACRALDTVYLGNKLSKIESKAFWSCSNIKTVYYYGKEADWYNIDIGEDYNSYLTEAPRYYFNDNLDTTEYGNFWSGKQVTGFKIDCKNENFIHSPYFTVKSNGKIIARDATLRGEIIADNGKLGTLQLMDGSLKSNNMEIKTASSPRGDESIISFSHSTGTATSIDSANIQTSNIEADSISTPVLNANWINIQDGLNIYSNRISYGDQYLLFSDSDENQDYTATLTTNSNTLTIKLNAPLIYARSFKIAYVVIWESQSKSTTITIGAGQTTGSTEVPAFWGIDTASIDETGANGNTYTFSQTKASDIIKLRGSFVPVTPDKYHLGAQDQKWNNIYACNGYFSNDLQLQSATVLKSDRNAKQDIERLPTSYEHIFDNLKPVRFKFIENQSERYHTGFIAQEVKESVLQAGLTTKDFAAYCEWVETNNVETCGLRYSELIPLNTDQIQKLKTRVTELEATVEELTKLINEKLN